jgi:hypothetical protein
VGKGAGHRVELLARPTGSLTTPKRVVSPQRVESPAHRIVRRRRQLGAMAAAPHLIDNALGRAFLRGEIFFLNGRGDDGLKVRRQPTFAFATGVLGGHQGAQGPSAGAVGSQQGVKMSHGTPDLGSGLLYDGLWA